MTDSKTSRVLIVDDMAINRMVLASLLATNGVASDQADNGTECVELCEKKDYDLILLDHRMPGMDGVDTLVLLKKIFADKGRDGCELVGRIRTTFPDSAIPTIFLTCKNDREHVFNILEYRPDGYLLKSSRKDTILDVIRRFFAESIFRLTVKTQ